MCVHAFRHTIDYYTGHGSWSSSVSLMHLKHLTRQINITCSLKYSEKEFMGTIYDYLVNSKRLQTHMCLVMVGYLGAFFLSGLEFSKILKPKFWLKSPI